MLINLLPPAGAFSHPAWNAARPRNSVWSYPPGRALQGGSAPAAPPMPARDLPAHPPGPQTPGPPPSTPEAGPPRLDKGECRFDVGLQCSPPYVAGSLCGTESDTPAVEYSFFPPLAGARGNACPRTPHTSLSEPQSPCLQNGNLRGVLGAAGAQQCLGCEESFVTRAALGTRS